jgi:hypothetical protein
MRHTPADCRHFRTGGAAAICRAATFALSLNAPNDLLVAIGVGIVGPRIGKLYRSGRSAVIDACAFSWRPTKHLLRRADSEGEAQ